MMEHHMRVVCVALLVFLMAAAGCGGGSRPRAAKDPYRFIREHNLDRLPRFDIPIEMNDRVVAWMEYFQGPGRNHFRRYMERSGRYLPLMQEILRKNGMPSDLVYVAMIESGFNTQARSFASAVGPWQFIGSTARRYGMRVDGYVDERRDPYISTQAAVEYFKDLYGEFGDWYLAMAGYNAGEGTVRRALEQTGSRDFWEIAEDRTAFRPETRDYVPKFIAAAIMAKMPERFGFEKVDYKPPFDYDASTVETQTDLAVIAKCAGVSEDDIVDLNPHLVRGTTPPGARNYQVRLPRGTMTAFKEKYAALPAEERIQIVRAEVRKGDTLARIAKRYGVSAQALAAANDLNPRQKRLQVGSTLVIPRGSAAQLAAMETDAKRRGRDQTREARGDRKNIAHTVRRGETLGAIARRYDVTPAQLMAWNNIKSVKKIHAGMQLAVKAQAPSPSSDEGQTPAGRKAGRGDATLATAPTQVHKVAKGDTLSTIASRYGVTVKQLMVLNDLTDPRRVRPGMQLAIRKAKDAPQAKEAKAVPKTARAALPKVPSLPAPQPIPSPQVAEVQVPAADAIGSLAAPAPEMPPATPAARTAGGLSDQIVPLEAQTTAVDLRERDVQGATAALPKAGAEKGGASKGAVSYKVKDGDTLWDIARRHKVSIAQIQQWNNLSDPSAVRPGTTLTIRRE